jgi:hypothetical protein
MLLLILKKLYWIPSQKRCLKFWFAMQGPTGSGLNLPLQLQAPCSLSHVLGSSYPGRLLVALQLSFLSV